MTRVSLDSLRVGDTFLRVDARGATDHVCTVLEVGLTAAPDVLGRVFPALRARADDGREGLVSYGPGGTAETP